MNTDYIKNRSNYYTSLIFSCKEFTRDDADSIINTNNALEANIFLACLDVYKNHAITIDEDSIQRRYNNILATSINAIKRYSVDKNLNAGGHIGLFKNNYYIQIKKHLLETHQNLFYSCHNCTYNTYCDDYENAMSDDGEMTCGYHVMSKFNNTVS